MEAVLLFHELPAFHADINVAQYYLGGIVKRVIYSLPDQSPPGLTSEPSAVHPQAEAVIRF